MKTKEIDVLVEPIFVNTNLYNGTIMKMNNDNPHMLKAKLIIELPERKAEITETFFEELYNQCRNDVGGFHNPNLFRALKQKIFGGEG